MSRPFRDITGQTFGPWAAVRRGERRRRATYWHCRAACGHEKVLALSALTQETFGACRRTRPVPLTPEQYGLEYQWQRRVLHEPSVAIAFHGRWMEVTSIPAHLRTIGEYIAYLRTQGEAQ